MSPQLEIFYNTTSESGAELKASKEKVKNQNELILEIFQRCPDKEFSPAQIFRNFNIKGFLLTSVRRAITTLEKQGYLIKTGNQIEGIYGKKNYTWKLNKI